MRWCVCLAGAVGIQAVSSIWAAPERHHFVRDGKPVAMTSFGIPMATADGALVLKHTRAQFYAQAGLGSGPLHIHARMAISDLERSAATFTMRSGSHFGFEGAHGRMFVSGSLFRTHPIPEQKPPEGILGGQPFDFDVTAADGTMEFAINGRPVHSIPVPRGNLGTLSFRPWRSTIRLFDFWVDGVVLPFEDVMALAPRAAKAYAIPVIDISGDTARRVIVAQGTADVYQGHPTTVLMDDGRTMFCAWTYDHGGACGPLKRSDDAGQTWSDLLLVPANWRQVRNCPSLYNLPRPDGVKTLFVFAGGPRTMRQAWSADGGATWTPYRDMGPEFTCVMAFCGILPVDGGARLLGLFHRAEPGGDLVVLRSMSSDGGMTWSAPDVICAVPGAHPCEPHMIRSPDGKRIIALMRENTRIYNSLMMVSNDEGRTWSQARELPAALTGDRHMSAYTPDGRLVVAFRDMAADSATKGHFCAWVGTFEDIVNGGEGQYRVKLLHSFRGSDCGYPGLECLSDGTLAATTYVQYRPEGEKHSVVSVRFKLAEIDALAQKQ